MHARDENSRLIEEIRRHGWRQGSVIPNGLVDQIFPGHSDRPANPDETRFLVLSHDCDLVHHDLTAEPNIEIISFEAVASGDGNFLHGKNPRRLHLSDHSGDHYFEFHAKNRLFCDRRLLAQMAPDPELIFSDFQIRGLTRWIALRYMRTAFPDAFNDRLRPAAPEISKLLKAGGRFITSILVAMDMKELNPDQTYNLILYVLMRDEDFNDVSRNASATNALNQIEAIINSDCQGVEVKESFVQSENGMSIADVQLLYRLEFDHLSHGQNDAGPSPRF